MKIALGVLFTLVSIQCLAGEPTREERGGYYCSARYHAGSADEKQCIKGFDAVRGIDSDMAMNSFIRVCRDFVYVIDAKTKMPTYALDKDGNAIREDNDACLDGYGFALSMDGER